MLAHDGFFVQHVDAWIVCSSFGLALPFSLIEKGDPFRFIVLLALCLFFPFSFFSFFFGFHLFLYHRFVRTWLPSSFPCVSGTSSVPTSMRTGPDLGVRCEDDGMVMSEHPASIKFLFSNIVE